MSNAETTPVSVDFDTDALRLLSVEADINCDGSHSSCARLAEAAREAAREVERLRAQVESVRALADGWREEWQPTANDTATPPALRQHALTTLAASTDVLLALDS